MINFPSTRTDINQYFNWCLKHKNFIYGFLFSIVLFLSLGFPLSPLLLGKMLLGTSVAYFVGTYIQKFLFPLFHNIFPKKEGPSFLNTLPLEVIEEHIASYLSPEETIAFKIAYKRFHNSNSVKVDSLYQPLLNRLKRLCPQISITAPVGLENTPWRYHFLKKAFEQAVAYQNNEIKYFKQCINQKNILLSSHLNHRLFAAQSATHLRMLEENDCLLDEINSEIINENIDVEDTKLNIENCFLTRIPRDVLVDPSLIDYWKELEVLKCGGNNIIFLPDEIGECASLRKIYCDYNQLKALPDSIGQLLALEKLYCHHNQITSLPQSIGNCVSLRELGCNSNYLTSLPETIGQLITLEALNVGYNQITALPNSLGLLVSLIELYVENNQLTDLPNSLGNCLELEAFECDDNQLSSLPEGLGQCANLEVLSCNRNYIKSLAPIFAQMLGDDAVRDMLSKQTETRFVPGYAFLSTSESAPEQTGIEMPNAFQALKLAN